MNGTGSYKRGPFCRHRFALSILLFFLIAAPPVMALTLRPHLVHNYTSEDGLPSTGIYSLDQAPDGRIWFISRNDVAAFDGFEWQTWRAGQGLPQKPLDTIRVDRSGIVRILIPGDDSLLACWDGETWTPIEGPAEKRPESLNATGFAVFEGSGDDPVIAVGTIECGLWLHHRRGWQQVGPDQGLPGLYVRSVAASGTGFLVATESGLAHVSADGTVDLSLGRLIPDGARDLLSAVGEGDDKIWVLSTDRLGVIEAGEYRAVSSGYSFMAIIDYRPVLLPVPGDAVYFGTTLDLRRFDPMQGEAEILGRHQGLLNEGATDLCLDREGNVWISGMRGVSKVVHTPFRSLRAADGLLEEEVTAICEPWPGALLLGHNDGLTILEDHGFRTVLFNTGFAVPRGQRRVLDQAPDGRGNCWIAGNGMDLLCISAEHRLTWYGADQGVPEPVNSVLVTPSGEVLAAGNTGLLRRNGKRFEILDWPGGPLPPVRRMFLKENGGVFLAMLNDGLWLAEDGEFTTVPGLETVDERRVTAVLENRDGSAWVGTWAGLFLLRDGQVERPQPPLDQVDDAVYFINRDPGGRLWFGGNNGVQRWDGEELKRFSIREGLAGREANRAAGFVDSRSRFWVGTEGGLSLFVGDEPFRDAPPPLTRITGLSAGDEQLGLDGPAEVGHRRNTLVFDYQAVSFIDEAAVRYQYYLEGFDETWIDGVQAATRRARFTNLPAGRYRFHLRAAGVPGTWSEPVASDWVTILRPFWLRWWFWLAVAVVLFQVGYWAVAAGSRKRYARKLSEEVASRTAELEESRAHYRLLFHGAAVPNLILDIDDGVILDANRAAENLCGLPEGGLKGRCPEQVGPAFLAEMLGLCRNAGTGEDGLQVAGEVATKAGATRDVEAWGVRLTLHGRRCLLVTAKDITGRRRLELEQLRASKLDSLGILAGGIAHDFNNMLTAILGNLSLALEDLPPGSDLTSLVESAIIASRNAHRLTSQLLTFARGGAPVRRATDIGKLLRDSVGLIMAGSSCTSELSIDPRLWAAEVDGGQLTQLFNNLMINACQAMPDGGRVIIRASNVTGSSPHLRITVADEGHGIPVELQSKVFDPYFSTKESGSGLGLATAYAVAKGHGGEITVQSNPGKGTLFQVIIPAAPGAAIPERKPEQPVHHGPGRILVMDDEPQILEFYNRALVRLGYQPETAADGETAVRLFREALDSGHPFGAVIMDLTVPGGMGGKEAVTHLLRLDPEVRVVVASGYSSDPILSDPQAYGFTEVLAKPFSLRAIADVLQAVLEDEASPGKSA